MARKILLSILVLTIAFCIGLSLVAVAGAAVIFEYSRSAGLGSLGLIFL